MPTLSAHVSDEIDAAVRAVAPKPGTWVAEAIQEKLEREGRLPGDPVAEVAIAAAELARVHGPAAVHAQLAQLADASLEQSPERPASAA